MDGFLYDTGLPHEKVEKHPIYGFFRNCSNFIKDAATDMTNFARSKLLTR